MPIWDNLFNLVTKVTSVAPAYTKEHCIAYKQSSSLCHICKDICPHEAISFKRGKEVEIDELDCTGCGLCVQHCPSQALEAKVNYQAGTSIKCSKVKGSAQTIQCLGRLAPSDLLRLASKKDEVTLARAECKTCSIGSEAMLEALEKTSAKAQALAQLRNRNITFAIVELETFDASVNPDPISRRELLKGGWRNVQQSAAESLAPFDPGNPSERSLPREMQRQYQAIAGAKPEPEQLVPWVLPRVAEGCIMCPVCTNACPSKAFSRDFKPEGKKGSVLMLEPERCNGCNACVKACPVKVISLDEQVSWAELSGGKQEAFYKSPAESPKNNVAR